MAAFNETTCLLFLHSEFPRLAKQKRNCFFCLQLNMTTMRTALFAIIGFFPSPTPTPSWANPVMNPVGQNVASYAKAYYAIGDINTLNRFVVDSNGHPLDQNTIQSTLQACNWGYAISLTNCTWSADNLYFTLTMRSTKMGTTGYEQYKGMVVHDTAKLILHRIGDNPFSP